MNLRFRYWRCVLIDQIMKAAGDLDSLHEALNPTYDVDQMANAEAQIWKKQATQDTEADLIEYAELDAAAIEQFETEQKWFDNVLYQREDHDAACELLHIPNHNPDTLRMPGMAQSKTLKYWQPVATKAIIDIQRSGTRGCVLGDMVGIGKTWIVMCWLLHVSIYSSLPMSTPPKPSNTIADFL